MKYDWVPWFTELSKKILEGGEADLINRSKQIDWRGSQPPSLLNYGDENIDPFSFIYLLASKNTTNQFEPVFRNVHKLFDISVRPPTEESQSLIIPPPQAGFGVLIHEGENVDRVLLWKLFRQTVEGAIVPDDFDQALKINDVEISNLTQTMFLINPNKYLPIDDRVRHVLGHSLSDGSKSDLKVESKSLQNVNINYESIMRITKEIKDLFPNCENFEINEFIYLQNNRKHRLITNHSRFFQVGTQSDGEQEGDYWEYTPGDDDEIRRLNFKENSWVFTGSDSTSGGTTYPIQDPQEGDVILVRTGRQQGRGVGVVTKNEYQDGWAKDRRIHVIWINKITETLASMTPILGFSVVKEPTYQAFAECEEYSSTFDLIESLQKKYIDVPQTKYPLNLILYGPPGTGKTWHTVKLSLSIVLGKKVEEVDEEYREKFNDHQFNISDDSSDGSGQIAFTTFHQNYAYEDFVEGIRPTVKGREVGYEIRDGIFKKLAKYAEDNPDKPYVLIIDEINRGNIAKIFGELITLIEDSKRLGEPDAKEVILPYSQRSFGVPTNLFIIGTMNTADRSIQILDTALRRRFTFVEMMPLTSHEKISTDINGINCQEILNRMNRRIFGLLDRERQIGHTYFFDVTTIEQLADVFQNRIIPLLQEYFFDDWSKIRTVLGNNEFVQEDNIRDPSLYGYRDSEIKYYERLPARDEKWKDPAHYIKIYSLSEVTDSDT